MTLPQPQRGTSCPGAGCTERRCMGNAFIEEVVTLAAVHHHIALVVGDLGYGVIESFDHRFPERYVNAGVAEQNRTGLAAGLVSEGYHIYTYSIATVSTVPSSEQVPNDIDYDQLSVTVVAFGRGRAYGSLGYSHRRAGFARMRSLPSMLIAAAGDLMECEPACAIWLPTPDRPICDWARRGNRGFIPHAKPSNPVNGCSPRPPQLCAGPALLPDLRRNPGAYHAAPAHRRPCGIQRLSVTFKGPARKGSPSRTCATVGCRHHPGGRPQRRRLRRLAAGCPTLTITHISERQAHDSLASHVTY